MSPRAAWRLETLGFHTVHDYVGGKADWLAAGQPTQGNTHRTAVSSLVQAEVPTCQVNEPLAAVVARMTAARSDTAIVINDQRVVLGRLRTSRFDEDTASTVDAVMEEGPTTIRADTDAHELLERMQARGTEQVIASTPEGHLLGVVYRNVLRSALDHETRD
jgi:predicted transcriptional regulator